MTKLQDLTESEFPHLAGAAYLNAASIGPMPERAGRAIAAFNALRARVHQMRDDDFFAPTREARRLCAELIGADPAEIALGSNTSFGINLAALGLQIPTRSTVVVPDGEFPANVYPWMNRARFDLEIIPSDGNGWPDIARILDRIQDPEVSVLAISSVQFATGYRADLELLGEACREADTIFFVDAIQSLGWLPLDVSRIPVDMVASGGHKWMCGPLGSGFAYVRREVQDRLEPVDIGWSSMSASQDLSYVLDYRWEFLPDARRYEVGTLPLQDHAGYAAALAVILEVGVQSIQAHVDELLAPLRAWIDSDADVRSLSPVDPYRRSAIVAIRTPAPEVTYRSLRRAGVVASLREGAVRFAPHFYNTHADIGKVIDVLEDERRKGWR